MRQWEKPAGDPTPNPKSIVEGDGYRITVLTPRLLRLEQAEGNSFTDAQTQAVANRRFDFSPFQVRLKGKALELRTDFLRLVYDGGPFSSNGLSIEVFSGINGIWHYGSRPSLIGGTARTLDEADGEVPLVDSIFSKQGYALINDSRSLFIEPDGWVSPRNPCVDLYFFAYGNDFLGGLEDFYKLAGSSPMLPRWALGNWWSRFHPYTDSEYLDLIQKFNDSGIPLCVSVLDMDWHVTSVDHKLGTGWTGYSWNRELLPDPEGFLQKLHSKGLKVTLNVHPADGVRSHEDAYSDMANRLGVASNFMDKIQFDVANREFMEAYFEFLHHPLEDAGVDFWWIDWQQQGGSSLDGVDPLWMLNHFHYADIKRKKERPLVLSRYAGTGSHRYPLGFSGDTCITWKSLEFQPKFTSAASCAGYGWWSHDIGGHFKGIHSAELQIRWLQLGVFSPIMRLHSSNSRFSSKDPWRLGPEMAQIATNFLRLRHSLIPYIYTMMELFNRTGAPLIQPMFFREPTAPDLWGQYWFGTQLIACPITSPMDQSTKLGGFKAWLPKGIWHDIFTGETYDGGRFLNLHRGIETIPVLAKAGAIIPISQEFENGAQNPARISLWVFSGSQGEFSLYEDNGAKPESIAQAITRFTLDSSGLTISAPDGDASLVPENRVYQVKFMGFGKGAVSAEKWDEEQGAAFVTVKAGREKAFVPVKNAAPESRIAERVFSLLQKAEIEYDLKRDIYDLTLRSASKVALLGELEAMSLPRPLASALTEIVAARIGERM